jgi:histone H3/H4
MLVDVDQRFIREEAKKVSGMKIGVAPVKRLTRNALADRRQGPVTPVQPLRLVRR